MQYNWQSITSPTPLDELNKLEEYCKRVTDDFFPPSVAIEIGSYEGGSAALMANYFDYILCLDPWGSHETQPGERIAKFSSGLGQNEHFPVFMQNIERLDLVNKIIPIVSTTWILTVLRPIYVTRLIFIDDAHTYNEVKEELVVSHEIIDPEGLVVVHDYMRQPYSESGDSYIGVKQAVDEVISLGMYKQEDYYSGIIALKKA